MCEPVLLMTAFKHTHSSNRNLTGADAKEMCMYVNVCIICVAHAPIDIDVMSGQIIGGERRGYCHFVVPDDGYDDIVILSEWRARLYRCVRHCSQYSYEPHDSHDTSKSTKLRPHNQLIESGNQGSRWSVHPIELQSDKPVNISIKLSIHRHRKFWCGSCSDELKTLSWATLCRCK